MFPKVAQIDATAVFEKVIHFKTAQKDSNVFGLLFQAKLLPRTLKNCPIWSHWSYLQSGQVLNVSRPLLFLLISAFSSSDKPTLLARSPSLGFTLIPSYNSFPTSFPNLLLIPSVTRFGDFLDFGQLFKAFGNNYFAQISYILRQIL